MRFLSVIRIVAAAVFILLAAAPQQAAAQDDALLQRYRSRRQKVTGGMMNLRMSDEERELRDSLTAAADSTELVRIDSLLRETEAMVLQAEGEQADTTATAAVDTVAEEVSDADSPVAAADSAAYKSHAAERIRELAARRDSLQARRDLLAARRELLAAQRDSIPDNPDSLHAARLALGLDSLDDGRTDDLSELLYPTVAQPEAEADTTVKKSFKEMLFPDSSSLSRVCWTAAVLPGYGQVYNKQYWKLPILYGVLGTSIGMFAYENKRFKPLRSEYDIMTNGGLFRTPEMDALQAKMIRSNTRRQLYLGAMVASYIYFIGDAAVNYSTNDISRVKKATTLSTICPGAGQIYNRSYWKVPFVIGGFASMIYCIDWNNRGYQRFHKAYSLLADYAEHPENYPEGPTDEFRGRYSASFIKNLKDSYRRNRDLCIILTAGVYILQIIDAHVDAHLKDYDISDDLTFNIEPMVQYNYVPTLGDRAMYGFNISLNF